MSGFRTLPSPRNAFVIQYGAAPSSLPKREIGAGSWISDDFAPHPDCDLFILNERTACRRWLDGFIVESRHNVAYGDSV